MEDVDREISEMKLSLNARARTVAESYLTAVSLGYLSSLLCRVSPLIYRRRKVQHIVGYRVVTRLKCIL